MQRMVLVDKRIAEAFGEQFVQKVDRTKHLLIALQVEKTANEIVQNELAKIG